MGKESKKDRTSALRVDSLPSEQPGKPICLQVCMTQMAENPPAMWENRVQSLGWEDPLEKGMATHSSIFAWRIPTDRGAWRATVHGVTKSRTQMKQLNMHTDTYN